MFVLSTPFKTNLLLSLVLLTTADHGIAADKFDQFLRPLLTTHCVKCHGEKKTKGKVNLYQIKTAKQFLAAPKLIKEMIEAVDARDMPPEEEKPLGDADRAELVATLKQMLRESTAGAKAERIQISRLNRFQYNNAVRDLFQLKSDVFRLSEKLMTRQSGYLASKPTRMPDRVNVACLALEGKGGLRGVESYPKDLRAQHGFDNQANQLTMSPLLLEAFLRLSVSILESPDFNEKTVGIWGGFFKSPPAGSDMSSEVRNRLQPFLEKAFRGPVEPATVNRYAAYVLAKMDQGLSFSDGMKKVASAVLSSPLFLYRAAGTKDDQTELASRLSFFLWASAPDEQLLALAKKGELSRPEVLNQTIDRMLADPKIERFLDTFPVQWMQLENILASVPDPKKHRYFNLDKKNPASLQMVLEPLLLFDAVFIEDRPIAELISPTFSYRSDFLRTWYTSDLKPPKLDAGEVARINRENQERRESLEKAIQADRVEMDALIKPIKARLLAERKKQAEDGSRKPVDLKPHAAWEFDGDLTDSISGLDLKAHGKVRYEEGMVVLERAFLQSEALPIELKAKTLEVWLKLKDVKQQGGGAMTIQGPGDFFDSIVLGERKARHWISGSNGFSRTQDFPGSTPEQKPNEILHLAMVYREDGTTTLYRNGEPYGKPYRKGAAKFPKGQTSVLFGLRHLPAGGNKYLAMHLDRARLYDRALSREEVVASSGGLNLYVSDRQVLQALSPDQKAARNTLVKALKQSEAALKKVPKPLDPRKQQQEAQKRFENEIRNQLRSRTFHRVAASDPRYGGVITNAATLTMTSSPKRTLPIARGAWVIEVILNDPPPPPPNDVPPLNEDSGPKNLTIREKFAKHRENPDCAGCHARIDPLGFALENFDITGRWRDKYENGRDVDASGKLVRKYPFDSVVQFKASLLKEKKRFAKAFAGHMLRFALARELGPADALTVDRIVGKTEKENFRLKSIIRQVILSDRFLQLN